MKEFPGLPQGSSSSESLGGIFPTVDSSSSSSSYVFFTNFLGLPESAQGLLGWGKSY